MEELKDYVDLRSLTSDKTPIREPFIIEAGGILTY